MIYLFDNWNICLKISCIVWQWRCRYKSKDWIALKWQILWKTNNSRYHSVLHLSLWDASSSKKTSYSEQQRRWSACADAQADLRLCCSHIYYGCFFFQHSRHRSKTSCTTFVWTALQWRTNIHTLKHWSTFVRGYIQNWIVVKVTFSKTVRGNEEWQIEYVIKNHVNMLCSSVLIYLVVCLPFLQGRHVFWLPVWFPANQTPSEKGLLSKERICSQWEQILFWYTRPFSEGCQNNFFELIPLKVYP